MLQNGKKSSIKKKYNNLSGIEKKKIMKEFL